MYQNNISSEGRKICYYEIPADAPRPIGNIIVKLYNIIEASGRFGVNCFPNWDKMKGLQAQLAMFSQHDRKPFL